MARYGKKASRKVKSAMHERKRGTLRSGRSGRKVKSKKQAIAIGLSEARPVRCEGAEEEKEEQKEEEQQRPQEEVAVLSRRSTPRKGVTS